MIYPDAMNRLQYTSHYSAEDKNIHLSLVKPHKDPRYLTRYEQLAHIPEIDEDEFHYVTDQYAFRTNSYYLSLIQWNDERDPIRRIIIPNREELDNWAPVFESPWP